MVVLTRFGMVMNLEQQIRERLIKSCSEVKADLLKLCLLKLTTVENRSALFIQCPNSWTGDRINDLLIGNLDSVLHSMGIDQVVLDDLENLMSYYCWDLTNLSFTGYFKDDSLNSLEIINIPTGEELDNMIGNQ